MIKCEGLHSILVSCSGSKIVLHTPSRMEEVLDLIASFHESSEYPVLCERIKAEINDRLSKSQTHYTNILESAETLRAVQAKAISESAATALTKILDHLAKLPSDEISMVLGLLV